VEVDMASRATRILTLLAAVSATAVLLSCGGSHDSLTGPSVVVPGDGSVTGLQAGDVAPTDLELVDEADVEWSADDPDGLSASCRGKTLICHKKKRSLWVSSRSLRAHLRHGDTRGRCAAHPPKPRPKPTPKPRPKPTPTPPPSAQCPCFNRGDIESAASQCSSLSASCPATFSLGLFCAPGGTGGTVGNVGYWEAVVGQDTCSWTSWDPITGDSITQTLPVDAAQFEACRRAITSSSPYPASCPQ
jgi:hypothetical protein